MKRISISDGIYRDERGIFWVRPTVSGKRTWRKLKAVTERHARKEGRDKLVAQERSKFGAGRDPFTTGNTFSEMSALYLAAHCPNKKLEPRAKEFCNGEKLRIESLNGFFGSADIRSIKLVLLPEYKKWRTARLIKEVSGERTVEMDLCTLSNVLNYAVATGHMDFNYIRSARPRFRSEIKHCRQFAPESADEIHIVASAFFEKARSEVMGWLTLFAAMSGCRINELVRLRMDATSPDQPGYTEGNFLFIRRSKHGINPFILVEDEFAEMFKAFRHWHATRWPKKHRWYFPGWIKGQPLYEHAFSHAFPRCAKAIGLPQRKAHGLRSFYVTKRRSDGASDAQIAAEIGDKTVALISKTYGSVPPNWVRKESLSFMPKKVQPAWKKWLP